MKAFELIHSLSKAEQKQFVDVAKLRSKKTAFAIYKYLLKTPMDQLDRNKMHRAVYGKKFSKEQDVLLRNGLKRLSDKLKDFLIDKQWEKEKATDDCLKNLWYLKALENRRLHNLLEKEHSKVYEVAKSAYRQDIQERVMHIMMSARLYYEDDPAMIQTIQNYLSEVKRFAHEHIRIGERYLSNRQWSLYVTNQKKSARHPRFTPIQTLDISNIEDLSNYGKFMYYMAQCFWLEKEEQINCLNKAEFYIDKCKNIPHYHIQKRSIIINRARTYYAIGLYKETQEQYLKAIEILKQRGAKNWRDMYNYLLAIVGDKKYELFWEAAERNTSWFETQEAREWLNALKAMVHFEQGDYDDVLFILGTNSGSNDLLYLGNKNLLIKTYYKLDDPESIDREINNCKQFFWNRKEHQSLDYKIYETYFQIYRLLINLKFTPKEDHSDLIKSIIDYINFLQRSENFSPNVDPFELEEVFMEIHKHTGIPLEDLTTGRDKVYS